MAFIHRFGSALNEHTHFHVVVIDRVFGPDTEQGVRFTAADAIDADAVQVDLERLLCYCAVKRPSKRLLAPPLRLSANTPLQPENPSPTPSRSPISGNRVAPAAQQGLPMGVDSTIGQRDIAVKTVEFPILGHRPARPCRRHARRSRPPRIHWPGRRPHPRRGPRRVAGRWGRAAVVFLGPEHLVLHSVTSSGVATGRGMGDRTTAQTPRSIAGRVPIFLNPDACVAPRRERSSE
ncbi:MAG: transposase [Thioalkalivibrio sp.]|nr:transposase [Thioalkalivibrio sp.]